MSQTPPQKPWDDWDGEYIGNIWGWKFSLISLAIILFMVVLMWYRHAQLPAAQAQPVIVQPDSSPPDSIGTEID